MSFVSRDMISIMCGGTWVLMQSCIVVKEQRYGQTALSTVLDPTQIESETMNVTSNGLSILFQPHQV
jgi:hypothetical protein